MNFKKLAFWTTLFTTAAVPLATAQNPVILQGNYVSNVFGQSNFVLNPNAQTNVANVTVSSATVTRSTTTPLVATSEFNITTSTSTGYADWATRTFDAGMKNQNCEARFTYRGFSVGTTKAQLIQNSLVVAELTLTASTDPRIASINFPCGDLTYATTFRLQQSSASLTGTNEIGGIYVGLATNQANVAQAEFFGRLNFGTNCTFTRTANTYDTPSDATCTTTATGAVTAVSGVKSGVTISNAKPGSYRVVFNTSIYSPSTTNYCRVRVTDGTTTQILQIYGSAASNIWIPSSFEMNFEYTNVASKTIEFQLLSGDNVSACSFDNGNTNESAITVYRFPTSSELVVTPQAAGIKYASNTGGEGTAANTNYTSSTYFSTAENGSVFPNLTQSLAGTQTCYDASFGEEIKTTDVLEIQILDGSGTGKFVTLDSNFANTSSFQYNNGKWFGIYASVKTASSGLFKVCFGNSGALLIGAYGSATAGDYTTWASQYTAGNRYRVIKRPASASNSALYVQGPVKASETGDTIPTGYQNEWSTRSITSTSVQTQATPSANTWYYPWTGELTLTAGNWMLCYAVPVQLVQSSSSSVFAVVATRIENKTDNTELVQQIGSVTQGSTITGHISSHSACYPTAITTSKTFRVGIRYIDWAATTTVSNMYLRCDQATCRLQAIRLN